MPDAGITSTKPQPGNRTLPAVSHHEQRCFMSYFPTGVTVVAAVDDRKIPYGMTCSSLTSVCLDPPIILVSLTTGSCTLRYAIEQGSFGVTLLDREAQVVAQRFAAPAVDRFTDVAWSFSPLGTPWLEQSMTAAADCDVWRTMEVGDHTLLFGRVRNIEVRGGIPLLYGLRRYHSL